MSTPGFVEVLALGVGYVAATALDLRPVRVISCWFLTLKLRLILSEIVDVSDDIADAIHEEDHLLAEGLADFYTELCCERDQLRVRLSELRS